MLITMHDLCVWQIWKNGIYIFTKYAAYSYTQHALGKHVNNN